MFKKNTAVTGLVVHLVSKTNGSDITTGTPVGYYTLDGGSQTAINDVTPVHEGNGEWSFDLLAGEMDGDIVGLTFTHVSAITVHFTIKTDTSIVSDVSSELATAQTDLDTITGADGALIATDGLDAAALATTAVDELADGVWDELLTGAMHNTPTSAGRHLREANAASGILNEGTAQAGAAGSITLAAAAESVEDEMYHDAYVTLVGGAGAGQVRAILTYTASTRVAIVAPDWAVTPNGSTEYVVAGSSQADLHSINESTAAADNLAADYDGTGYDKANSTIGTCTVNTDMVGTDNAALASVATEERLAELDGGNMPSDLSDVLEDTNELQTDNVPTLIAALPTAVENRQEMDSNSTELALILADTNELQVDDVPGLIAALNNVSNANVLAQVNTALDTAIAELGVAAPVATPTLRTGLMLLYMAIRNKRDTTATSDEIHNNAGAAIADATLSDDTVTFTKTKYT